MKLIILSAIFLLSSCQKCVESKDVWIKEEHWTSFIMVGKIFVPQFHANPAHTGSVCTRYEDQ